MNEQEKKQFQEDMNHIADTRFEDRLADIEKALEQPVPPKKVIRFSPKAIVSVAAAVAILLVGGFALPYLKGTPKTVSDESLPSSEDIAKDGERPVEDAEVYGESTLDYTEAVDTEAVDTVSGSALRKGGSGNGNGGTVPVAAGTLTAGRWNDLTHWNDWLTLIGNGNIEFRQTVEDWRFTAVAHRLTVTVKAGEKPLPCASVSLTENGKTVFEAVTNADGVAYLFAKPEEGKTYRVTAVRESAMVGQNIAPQGGVWQDVTLSLDGASAPAKALDLLAVIDTTGSMGDELSYLQAELADVVKTVAKQNSNLSPRISVNFYRDTGDEYVVRPFPFTTDIDKAEKQLAEQKVDGGGDYEEAVEKALTDAMAHDWRPDSVKILLLVLDAPPHATDTVKTELQKAINEAAAKGVRIVPVAASGVDKATEALLRIMAAETGGEYVFLTDSSGVGGSHEAPTIGQYHEQKLNELLVDLINDYLK